MSKDKQENDEGERISWRRADDPFHNAKPLADLTVLIDGLPDNRDADEILRDLRQSRAIRLFDQQ